jgi:putative salt-induced outer membrane protein
MWKRRLFPALLLLAPATAVHAEAPPPARPAGRVDPLPLQPAVRLMLETAIASGNQADIDAVARVARAANPAALAEIAAIMDAYDRRKATEHKIQVQNASLLQLWNGKGELGGFRSTGSTSEIGISAGITLQRTGLKWSHTIAGTADYRRANGETSRERFVASYQPRYQFDPIGFVYGLVQYERDPFIGFDARYTGSSGIGYKLIQGKKLNLSLDVGPSVRHVVYTDGSDETKLGGRSSLDFGWALSPTLTLRQTASGYAENDARSLNAQTSLTTRIVSRLSANFSYNVQYETQTRLTDEKLDTLSKATLVYDF